MGRCARFALLLILGMAVSACASLNGQSLDGQSLNTSIVTDVEKTSDTTATQLRTLGYLHHQKNQFELAVDVYSKAIGLEPGHAKTYYNRGTAYVQLKEFDKAIADFGKAIELNPDHAAAYNNRGIAYRNKSDFERAIADYSRAIELRKQYPNAHFNLGNAYRKKGDIAKAITSYKSAIRIKPNFARAHGLLGFMHALQRDYHKALESLDHALKLDPDLKFARKVRTQVIKTLGQEVWLVRRKSRNLIRRLPKGQETGSKFITVFCRQHVDSNTRSRECMRTQQYGTFLI